MKNPWEEITLETYEKHMSLDSVRQLQALDRIMGKQLTAYRTETVMILGIAGGNGLSHIRREQYRKVCGVDINADYLRTAGERYPQLAGVLECLRIDLTDAAAKLPQVQLVIADLLIEYIGYPAFQRAVQQAAAEYVSCVIQINTDASQWVSDSPYLHAFDGLDAVHHQMEPAALTDAMRGIGYTLILTETEALPNGKALVRLDYQRNSLKGAAL